MAIGIASSLSPVYIAEVAPAQVRGKLVSLNQLTIVIGILLLRRRLTPSPAIDPKPRLDVVGVLLSRWNVMSSRKKGK